MQSRMPILIAVAAGIAAIVLMNLHIAEVRRAAQPDLVRIVVAATDLRSGQTLEGKDIAMAMKPKNALPKLAINWEERSLYLGQISQSRVQQGDYLLASYFGTQAAQAARFSDKIDAEGNRRAMTIPVSNVNSIEGAIRAGDRIDLLLTYTSSDPVPGESNPRPKIVTSPLMENVYVLFTGAYGSPSAAGYGTLTVLVSPEEAMLLIWGMRQGEMSVLLRNAKDVRLGDRAYLRGDAGTLSQLGKVELKPDAILSARRSESASE